MISKENTKLAYGLAAVLLVVGIVCYAAGDPEVLPGEEPVRKVFLGNAGNVMFDHQGHIDYADDCTDCHHHGEEEDFAACDTCHLKAVPATEPDVCSKCHPLSDDDYMQDVHYEHHVLLEDDPENYSCKSCHQLAEGEAVPVACEECHDPEEVEGQAKIMTYEKDVDAMHGQCIGCHEEYDAGPMECNECHAQ